MWFIRSLLWCVNGCVLWGARLLTVAVLGLGAVVWAAQRAPVVLPDMAVDQIAALLDRRAGDAGLGVALSGAEFALRDGLVPTLSLHDVVLRDGDGVDLMHLDRAETVFSRRAALQGRVAPVVIAVRGLDLQVERDETGAITLRLGQAALVEGAPDPAAALARLQEVLDTPALAGLRRVGLDDVSLSLRDAAEDRTIRASRGTLQLDRTGTALVLDMSLSRLEGGNGAGGAAVHLELPGAGIRGADALVASTPMARLRVTLRGVEPAGLAGFAGTTPLGAALARIAAPVSLDLEGGLGPDGQALPFGGALRAGAGYIDLPGDGDPIALHGLRADLRLSADRRHLVVRDLFLDSAAARVAGDADLRSDGLGGAITAQLALRDVAVDIPRDGQAAVALRADRLWADLRAGGPGGAVELAAFTVERDGARASGTGVLWPDGRLALDMEAAHLDIDGALALWPEEIAPRARIWMAQTASAGTLHELRLSLRHDLRNPRAPGRIDDTALSFGLQGAAMRIDPRLPPVTDLAGLVEVGRDRAALSLTHARMAPSPETGVIRIGPGRVWAETGPAATGPLRVQIAAEADLPAAMALLQAPMFQPAGASPDAPPAGPAGVVMTPGNATGDIAVTLDLALPLRREGPPPPSGPRPEYTLTGQITDASSAVLVPDRVVTAARLDLRADPSEVSVTGQALVGTIPVDLRYARALAPSAPLAPSASGVIRPVPRGGSAPSSPPGDGPGGGRLVAELPVRPEDLAGIGLPLPAGALRGAGRARVTVDFPVGAAPSLSVEADLAGLAVSMPGIGVTKAAGVAAQATVRGRLGPVPVLERVTLDMPGTAVVVRLPDGMAGAVRLDRLALGGWLDAQGRFEPAVGGAPARLVLRGGRADLRVMPRGAGGAGPRLAVDLALDRVVLAEGIALTGLRGTLSPDLYGTLDGQVNGAAPVRLRLAPGGGDDAGAGPALHLTAADGGAVLRASGLARGLRAGALDLRLVPTQRNGTYRGQVRLDGFELPQGGAAALRAGGGVPGDDGDWGWRDGVR